MFVRGALFRQRQQLGLQAVFLLHRVQQLRAGQLVPRGGDDGRARVARADHGHGPVQLRGVGVLRARQQNRAGVLDLVVVKLAEVLHIQAHLVHVGHRHKAGQLHVGVQVLHGADHVRQLAHAGRLDEDAVGVVRLQHFGEGLAEIAHQAAADAAGVHLRHLDAGLLHEAAVDADLAELILDQHQLLTRVRLADELFDQRRLAGAQKPGKNGDLCHGIVCRPSC